MQQAKCTKVEREMNNGGNREGVAWVEGETPEGTGAAQIGERSTARTGIAGGVTCIDRSNYVVPIVDSSKQMASGRHGEPSQD